MTPISREEAKRRIQEAGLRATAPRVAVLRALARASKPVSHSDVVKAIGDQDWDQATLFRNLQKLTEAELARVANRVDGIVRYELHDEGEGPHLHPHFSCKSCGSVQCLPHAKLAGPVDKQWHRSIEQSELQLIGECPDCLGKQKKKPRSKKAKG